MMDATVSTEFKPTWVQEKLFLGMTFKDYLRSNFTLFNAVVGLILAVGIPVIIYRLLFGLGPSTNLSDNNPWGIWIGFDMLCGVALAAGGFVIGTAVHLLGMKEYGFLFRPAVLTGFLGYLFAIIALTFDLGRSLSHTLSNVGLVGRQLRALSRRMARSAVSDLSVGGVVPCDLRVAQHEKGSKDYDKGHTRGHDFRCLSLDVASIGSRIDFSPDA